MWVNGLEAQQGPKCLPPGSVLYHKSWCILSLTLQEMFRLSLCAQHSSGQGSALHELCWTLVSAGLREVQGAVGRARKSRGKSSQASLGNNCKSFWCDWNVRKGM